jgi:rare lipoprotein A
MRSPLRTATVVLTLIAGLLAVAMVPAALASVGGTSAPEPSETTAAAGTTTSAPSSEPATTVHPTGVATWFGPGFYGHKTACGQTLTPAVVGVANRTLPCGTLIRVAYHGHAVTVPVLDRGPYSHGAEWDLTAGAAQALGITETVHIHTSVVGLTANSPTLGLPPSSATTVLEGGALAG